MPQTPITVTQAFAHAREHYLAGRLDLAELMFRQIITHSPSAEAYFNYGKVLKDLGRLDESADAYRHAIALRPDLSEAYNNLASVLKETGQLDEALSCYRKSLSLRPDQRVFSNPLYLLWFLPQYDATRILEEHRAWGRMCSESVAKFSHPHVDRNPARRLRIGYVSPDFRAHVVGFNLLPLFREQENEQFEVFCYSNVAAPDALTQQFRSLANHWREIRSLDDQRAAELVHADQIDILVDLSLHMSENRLSVFARKPAPIQVTFGGYPGTTGLPEIDYRLTDPFLDDPAQEPSYSEESIYLPHSFWCYRPFHQLPITPLPALRNSYITFGCLNNFSKVNEQVLELWARVMAELPESRLILMSRPGSHRQRTLNAFAKCEISSGRLRFVDFQPLEDYLQTYHEIDIGLDTFPYNGHTTSLDSYWMGVPVVTLKGGTVVGRAGYSHLSNLGLADLVANNPEKFVATAVKLASDMGRLATSRNELRDRMRASPLMNAEGFARGIEGAYRQMWRKWRGG